MQKYRADEKGETCKNGATPWYTKWMGGPTLALIRNCPTPQGPRTVYISGEPDTFFSIPAKCSWKGKTWKGWLGCEDGEWIFHCKDMEIHDVKQDKRYSVAEEFCGQETAKWVLRFEGAWINAFDTEWQGWEAARSNQEKRAALLGNVREKQ